MRRLRLRVTASSPAPLGWWESPSSFASDVPCRPVALTQEPFLPRSPASPAFTGSALSPPRQVHFPIARVRGSRSLNRDAFRRRNTLFRGGLASLTGSGSLCSSPPVRLVTRASLRPRERAPLRLSRVSSVCLSAPLVPHGHVVVRRLLQPSLSPGTPRHRSNSWSRRRLRFHAAFTVDPPSHHRFARGGCRAPRLGRNRSSKHLLQLAPPETTIGTQLPSLRRIAAQGRARSTSSPPLRPYRPTNTIAGALRCERGRAASFSDACTTGPTSL